MHHSTFQALKMLLQTIFKCTNLLAACMCYPLGTTISISIVHEKSYPYPIDSASNRRNTLREKCPYSDVFWSVFSLIWTEYGEILRSISPYSVRMKENTDQKNYKYGPFSRSENHNGRFYSNKMMEKKFCPTKHDFSE